MTGERQPSGRTSRKLVGMPQQFSRPPPSASLGDPTAADSSALILQSHGEVKSWTGPDGPYVRAVRDIYVGLATLQTASMIEHVRTRETIQKAAVELISEQSKTLSKAEFLDLGALEGNAQAKVGAKVQR